jgi:hypothetical protein
VAAVYRDGNKAETVRGERLRLVTRRGERLVHVAAGTNPGALKRIVPEA